jgi:hypothetical protein
VKIIVFILTALIQLAVAVVCFFMLLLGLNGFSEQQATPSLIFFIALSFVSAVGLGGVSAFVAKTLVEKKSLGRVAASAIAVVGFSILGAVVLFVGFIAAVLLASLMHEWR